MTSTEFVVTNGPSREAIFDNLRLAIERRAIAFDWLRSDGQIKEVVIHISGISIGGHKLGDSWIIKGEDIYENHNVVINYNTAKRNGTIQFCAEN